MLRITIQKSFDAVVLRLEGSVKGPWVDELQEAWLTSAKMAVGEPVSIDLEAVSFIDARGRDLLMRIQREGVALMGASSFLRQVLEDRHINSEQIHEDRSSK